MGGTAGRSGRKGPSVRLPSPRSAGSKRTPLTLGIAKGDRQLHLGGGDLDPPPAGLADEQDGDPATLALGGERLHVVPRSGDDEPSGSLAEQAALAGSAPE